MRLLSLSVPRSCGVSLLIRQLSAPKTVNLSRKRQKTLGIGFKWSGSSAESWPQTCPFWPGDVSEPPSGLNLATLEFWLAYVRNETISPSGWRRRARLAAREQEA